VQAHAESFFAQVEAATGAGLPEFVKEEFDAFLECGVLAHYVVHHITTEDAAFEVAAKSL
jgi:hypothetical protein